MEFGLDNYGGFEDVKDNDDHIIVEHDASIKINKMAVYDEQFHKKEMGSIHNGEEILYCSWPSIVKISSTDNDKSDSRLFARLSDTDLNPNEDNSKFLTRAFVF